MMNRRSFLTSMAVLGSSFVLKPSALGEDLSAAKSPVEQAEAIRTAATQFLQILTPEHRNRITYAFPAHETPIAVRFARIGGMGGEPGGNHPPDGPQPTDRPFNHNPNDNHGPGGGQFAGFIGEKYGQSVWTNFPVSDVPRPGVRMGEFNPAENNAAHALLRTVLSPMGYQKVIEIMTADQILADSGVPYAAGLDAYTLALFGRPDAATPWMLQFGGHHLGLNITFVGEKAVLAPLHTGILPSHFQKRNRTIRALGRENDKAFDLLATLTPTQLKTATIDHEVSDLVCGPGHPIMSLSPQGLRGSDMTDSQRTMMFELSREWVSILNDVHSAPRLNAIRLSLDDTYFAWSGPTTHEVGQNGESYFRIHGPSLLIEHAPQGNQGGYKLHVHTVMRDLQNDYAKQLV